MDCHQQSYKEFSQQVHSDSLMNRLPVGCTFEITDKCNFRCVHCYICQEPVKSKDLSTKQIKEIIDVIVQNQGLWLLLTGGEPLLRKDFSEIYLYAKKKGLLITVYTNGTLITEEIAKVFSKYPPFAVEITLYGATAPTYERVTQKAGSFERCWQGIRRLLKHRVPLNLKTVLMTLNKEELEQMEAQAEKYGIQFRYDPLINPTVSGSKVPTMYRLSPEEIVALDCARPIRVKAYQQFCQKNHQPIKNKRLYQCGAGVNQYHIDSQGNVSICLLTRKPAYSLFRYSFKEIWDKKLYKFVTQERQKESPCYHCQKVAMCGYCPTWAFLENGDPRTPIKYLCEIAHLRTKALGLFPQQKEECSRQNPAKGVISCTKNH